MSAVRRNDRRTVRNQTSSPYKRPTKQKSSGWSFSGLLSYIVPSRLMKGQESEEEEQRQQQEQMEAGDGPETPDASDEEKHQQDLPQAAKTLSHRGHQLAARQHISSDSTRLPNLSQASGSSFNPIILNSNSPPSTPSPSNRPQLDTHPSPSPAQNLDAVKKYLHDRKNDQPLHQVELIGLMSLLQGSVGDEEKTDEHFRFSSSQPPSRSTSPIFNPGSPSQTPRRTLSKNPNGTYRWQGAGSARPRTRYQSPAFGSPRLTPSKLKLSPPKSSKTDSKRRRVGEEAETSSPQRVKATPSSTSPLSPTRADPVFSTGSFPISNVPSSTSAPSSSTMSGSSPSKPSIPPIPATPRLRAAVLPKPSAPAVPSPLRNGWGQSDSSSPPQQQTTPSKKPTKAANFMSELIKEVTPPKKPDVANPYQAALPARVPVTKRPVKKRKAPEEDKPAAKEKKETEEKEKEKEKKDELAEMSPQSIIEATVPKGSKRARPPPNLERQTSPKKFNGLNGSTPLEPPRRSARLKSPEPSGVNGFHGLIKSQSTPTVVEEEDKAERPSPKKQKIAFSSGPTVEEVEDVDMPDADKSKSSTTRISRPTEVIEPGDAVSSSSLKSPINGTGKAAFGLKSSIPKEPSKLRFGFAAEPEEAPSSYKLSAIPIPDSASISAPKPAFEPKPSSPPSASSSVDPKTAAAALAPTALPTFSFTISPPDEASLAQHAEGRDAAKALPPSALPSFSFTLGDSKASSSNSGFNWAAAGMKAPAKLSEGMWTCGMCMLSNPASAKDCTICEAPAPASAAAAPTTSGFDRAAAGMKSPAKASGETWTCRTCMLSNPADATDCTVCEAPRP